MATRRAFMVKELPPFTRVEKVPVFEAAINEKGQKYKRLSGWEDTEVEHPGGWMVFFPQGHSVRIDSEDVMRKQGFFNRSGLIDMDTGEPVEESGEMDLEQMIIAREASRSPFGRLPGM